MIKPENEVPFRNFLIIQRHIYENIRFLLIGAEISSK